MASDHLTTSDLQNLLTKPDTVLLDDRPMAAYNGWALNNEPRGGHIQGAVAFDLNWTEYDGWSELLRDKNITPEKNIIVYGYDADQGAKLADELRAQGYKNVNVFDRFTEWSADKSLPMEHLPGYRHLVYPAWLKSLMAREEPPEYEGNKYVVCHAAFNNRLDYEDGHIPGAVFIDTLELESPETWNRRSPEEIRDALIGKGISRDTTVVLYGRDSKIDPEEPHPGSFAGQLAAMRCMLIMLYAGVRDVRILNGGLAAWERAGYGITTEETKCDAVQDFGVEIPDHPEYIVDLSEAKQLLAADNGELVSIRSWEEFIGNVSGYNYIGKTGRIPGAVFGNCGSDAYHMENYRNIDQTMRSYREIAAFWKDNGIVPEKHVAFYCGTGWRASEAFFHAWLMGWPRVSVYDGGWFEWSSDPANPVETGQP